MKNNSRRSFLKATTLSTAGAALLTGCQTTQSQSANKELADYTALDQILSQPILDKSLFTTPLIIEDISLLEYEQNYICIVRTKDGQEGISVSNNMQMQYLFPIFIKRVQPFFIGKDARDFEELLEELYVFKANYKLQNLALWVPIATLEFAVLDLLGKTANRSIGALLGGVHHPSIGVYRANNFRGESAEVSLEKIKEQVYTSKAKAMKFKIGGRMSHNQDFPANRTEQLIPMVRKEFGDEMIIYADSNGSYTPDEAIRIGQLMETYRYDFFEEPVPFDW